jgi:hypothetical protein
MRTLGIYGASIAAMAIHWGQRAPVNKALFDVPIYTLIGGYNTPPYGSSKWSVAKDKRRSMKRKAVKRARRLGHA